MTNINDNIMLIATGLKGQVNYSILDNVIGQLSDGMWENSPTASHYWPFAEIKMDENDNVFIVIYKPGSNKEYCCRDNNIVNNWFVRWDKMNCDRSKIRNYFVKKIQQLVSDERKSYPNRNIKFSSNCNTKSNYFWNGATNENHTISDIYNTYKTLKDFR